MGWLGYDSGIDVVGFELNTDLAPPNCVVDARSVKSGDFGDALRAENSGQWRECINGDIRVPATLKPADCLNPHVAEYIGASVRGVAKPDECEIAARSFLGRADLSELTVYPLAPVEPGLAKSRCMVAITSGKPLNDTLRRLGNANLPRVS